MGQISQRCLMFNILLSLSVTYVYFRFYTVKKKKHVVVQYFLKVLFFFTFLVLRLQLFVQNTVKNNNIKKQNYLKS